MFVPVISQVRPLKFARRLSESQMFSTLVARFQSLEIPTTVKTQTLHLYVRTGPAPLSGVSGRCFVCAPERVRSNRRRMILSLCLVFVLPSLLLAPAGCVLAPHVFLRLSRTRSCTLSRDTRRTLGRTLARRRPWRGALGLREKLAAFETQKFSRSFLVLGSCGRQRAASARVLVGVEGVKRPAESGEAIETFSNRWSAPPAGVAAVRPAEFSGAAGCIKYIET
jgi:hypothetical protein